MDQPHPSQAAPSRHPFEALIALLPRDVSALHPMPVIDCSRAVAMAASHGLHCPDFDDALIAVYAARMVKDGLVPPPVRSRQAETA